MAIHNRLKAERELSIFCLPPTVVCLKNSRGLVARENRESSKSPLRIRFASAPVSTKTEMFRLAPFSSVTGIFSKSWRCSPTLCTLLLGYDGMPWKRCSPTTTIGESDVGGVILLHSPLRGFFLVSRKLPTSSQSRRGVCALFSRGKFFGWFHPTNGNACAAHSTVGEHLDRFWGHKAHWGGQKFFTCPKYVRLLVPHPQNWQ